MDTYIVRAFVATGFYEYEVKGMARAIDHAQQILSRACIRVPEGDDTLNVIPVYQVRVIGPGIGSTGYPATFGRT